MTQDSQYLLTSVAERYAVAKGSVPFATVLRWEPDLLTSGEGLASA
jgi:hypothetical protein